MRTHHLTPSLVWPPLAVLVALSVLLPAMGEPTAAVYAGIDASALMRELGLPTPRILSCDLAGVHYSFLAPEANVTSRDDVVARLTAAGAKPEAIPWTAPRIDAAAAAGAGPMDSLNVTDLLSGGSIVTFGVNNERALRDRALSDGMAQARELATAAVAKAGKKLGEVSGLQIQPATDSTLMKALTVMGAPISPGKAHYQIFTAVTFKVQ